MDNNDRDYIVSRCGKVERPCLYIMLIITMITSCDNYERLKRIEDALKVQQVKIVDNGDSVK